MIDFEKAKELAADIHERTRQLNAAIVHARKHGLVVDPSHNDERPNEPFHVQVRFITTL